MKVFKHLIPFSILVAGLSCISTASAVPMDYRATMGCTDCQELTISNYTNKNGLEFMLGLFYDSDGDLSNGENRINVYFNAEAGSQLILDVANESAYIVAKATTYTANSQDENLARTFEGRKADIYFEYTNVKFELDDAGNAIGLSVTDATGNGGHVTYLNDDGQKTRTDYLGVVANSAGVFATGFGEDSKFSGWVNQMTSVACTNVMQGNNCLDLQTIKGDFHFLTNTGSTEVPEPMTSFLLGSALLGGLRLKKRKSE